MKTIFSIFVLVFFLSYWVFSQDPPTNSHSAEELIIRYEVLSSFSSERLEKGILAEHEQFVSAIKSQFSLLVLSSQPVFRSFVHKMVMQGISESTLLEKIRQRNQARRGRSLPKYALNPNNSFCRTLSLIIETGDLEGSIQQIQNASESLEPFGFRILYVADNPSFSAIETPNDPWFPNQYAHQLTGAPTAWEVQRGKGEVIIGVLDSGIDFMHEDFEGNLLHGADFVHWPIMEEWEKVEGEDILIWTPQIFMDTAQVSLE